MKDQKIVTLELTEHELQMLASIIVNCKNDYPMTSEYPLFKNTCKKVEDLFLKTTKESKNENIS